MTIAYWSRMLSPFVLIHIYRKGVKIGQTTAEDAAKSEYAELEIADWRMHSFQPLAKVVVR